LIIIVSNLDSKTKRLTKLDTILLGG